jgi:hypothetical protein
VAQADEPAANGVAAEWEVSKDLTDLAAGAKSLEPVLKLVLPEMLKSNGAPETYLRQLNSTLNQMQHLNAAVDRFARQPDKLTAALEAYFHMQSTEQLAASLAEGIRNYQSPDLANKLTEALAANSVHRDRLRRHIMDLAAQNEQEFEIADAEAQRCRGMISRQTTAPAKKGKEGK